MRYFRFRRLVAQYQDDIFRFARHLLGQQEDAEDVTQEVLLTLWDHMDTIDQQKIKSWIMTTTHHRSMDVLRRRQPLTSLDAVAHLHAPDSSADRAEWAEEQSLVRAAISRLPDSMRAAVILRDIEGYPYADIAEILEQPENTVSAAIHRGRQQLRTALQSVYAPEVS